MRKLMPFSLLVAAFFAMASMPLMAQDIEQELSAFTQKWQEAYNRGDHETLATLYSQEVVLLEEDGVTSTKITKEQMLAQLEKGFAEFDSEIDIKITRMMAQPGGKVKVSGTFTNKSTDKKSAKTIDLVGTFEHEVVKEGNDWKLCQMKVTPN